MCLCEKREEESRAEGRRGEERGEYRRMMFTRERPLSALPEDAEFVGPTAQTQQDDTPEVKIQHVEAKVEGCAANDTFSQDVLIDEYEVDDDIGDSDSDDVDDNDDNDDNADDDVDDDVDDDDDYDDDDDDDDDDGGMIAMMMMMMKKRITRMFFL